MSSVLFSCLVQTGSGRGKSRMNAGRCLLGSEDKIIFSADIGLTGRGEARIELGEIFLFLRKTRSIRRQVFDTGIYFVIGLEDVIGIAAGIISDVWRI